MDTTKLKIYCAPLESVTTYSFRAVHAGVSNKIDCYFIPFLEPMEGGKLSKKGEKEIDPNNNIPLSSLVPQILCNNSKNTLALLARLKKLGYQEANLNFGCPSGTVTAKGKGSGMFKDLARMEEYLKEVFASSPLPLSIKTRVGFASSLEWRDILDIYNQYPIKELIIHPRTGKEGYTGPLHLELLDGLDKKSDIPIVYNGEIKSLEDIAYLKKRYPYLAGVMVGRGLLEAPDLFEERLSKEQRKAFLRKYADGIDSFLLSTRPWGNAIHPLKASYGYLANRFAGNIKIKKKLLKANDQEEFFALVSDLFSLPLLERIQNGIAKD